MFRSFLLKWSGRIQSALRPKQDPDLIARNNLLSRLLREAQESDRSRRESFLEMVSEMTEAVQMCGSGPWRIGPETVRQTTALISAAHESFKTGVSLREANPIAAQGAFGDIELALQNVEWRREINLSWLEFSRWGIQQIILISRLYWVKNPIIRRLIDIGAIYVFGRGYELSSPDPDANEVLKQFLKRNKKILGQVALTKLHQRKFYDGNLFFACFTDELDKGTLDVRTIDATEIQEIVCDPEDADTPWFYKRIWTQNSFDPQTGITKTETQTAWYPDLRYKPTAKPDSIGGHEVRWKSPILHRKCGEVAKWHFGCPPIYPALDWARAARNYLENCATTAKAHATIATLLTTKGGQQAMEGAKQQLGTTVGPDTSPWDTHPPGPAGSIFASGPGTTLAAMKTRGAGSDPEEVRRFLLMCCMVRGVPETFLGDVSTGNLATATTLDRPTELAFLMEQEEWREDLVTLGTLALEVSGGAANGILRESINRRKVKSIPIREASRVMKNGKLVYEAQEPGDDKIEILATFPSIREGDIPALIASTVQAMTLGSMSGQVLGIDERAGVRKLYELSGIENGDELVEEQYPLEGADKYDPLRTKEEPESAPLVPKPNGLPPRPATEAVRKLAAAVEAMEASSATQ